MAYQATLRSALRAALRRRTLRAALAAMPLRPRRLALRPKTLETRWDDLYALVLLTLIPIAGFTLEGTRLAATSPAWSAWSPVW